ncbi:DUF1642 domain-containing protein [Schleiferilactobacillus shenzhenensis]|uniref:DUF1642 domain-containing protein n=1 Tax=Schleiferilactobacillus shenzhenensis LY-73 TaxID=1231336 RepID=U4TIL8_9LACO|nr:DUF1642 domain-containing protein [Schleiferilactobacillus shenzhenensis]ERL64029.1 hypothetical protein L248_1676 [Schleiferilactobacillus shenzhenensis LY-73]
MNREEAKKNFEKVLVVYNSNEHDFGRHMTAEEFSDRVEQIIDEINAPEKVRLPKTVGDWVNHCQAYGDPISLLNSRAVPEKIWDWLEVSVNRQMLVMRAFLYGWEPEPVKRYRVKVPIVWTGGGRQYYWNKDSDEDKIHWDSEYPFHDFKYTAFTMAEIKHFQLEQFDREEINLEEVQEDE